MLSKRVCRYGDGSVSLAVANKGGLTVGRTCGDICVAVDQATLDEIRCLRKSEYKNIYPTMDLDNDPLDDSALTIYTRSKYGNINSTARLALDGPHGFPEDSFLDDYRKRGRRLIEWGRFIIKGGDIQLLKRYYWTVFSVASRLNCDAIVMAMKPKDISLHKRVIGIDVVAPDMKINYGGHHSLACVVWEVEGTKPTFFQWIGINK